MHDPFTREAYSRDPRNVARKAENYLASTGIADTAYFGAEAEFYIFDSVSFDSQMNGTFYEIDSEAGWWNTGEPVEADGSANRGYKVRPKGGYFPVAPYDHFVDLRDAMCTNLQNAGLELEKGHHEVGTAGQAEINYKFNTLLHAADDLQLYNHHQEHGVAGRQDRDIHAQAAVWRQRPACTVTSHCGRKAAPCSTTVGLRRLVGYRPPLHRRPPAPRPLAVGVHQPDGELLRAAGAGLRSTDQPGVQPAQPLGVCAYPDHRQQPEGKAPRVPVARQLGQPVPGVRGDDDGGLDGIKKKMEPQAPVDKDLYELPPDEAASIPQAPTSLSAVIDRLEEDHEYLTEGGVFTEDLIETWISFKRENEILPVQIRPHPYEVALYFDV